VIISVQKYYAKTNVACTMKYNGKLCTGKYDVLVICDSNSPYNCGKSHSTSSNCKKCGQSYWGSEKCKKGHPLLDFPVG
jgi:hypothetical protein